LSPPPASEETHKKHYTLSSRCLIFIFFNKKIKVIKINSLYLLILLLSLTVSVFLFLAHCFVYFFFFSILFIYFFFFFLFYYILKILFSLLDFNLLFSSIDRFINVGDGLNG
jgi:hypothetical protein